ncbi:hypothetical protein [Dyadobacter sediminis]|uniref:hypothetical protein n=1 Tax=Dyadobacter sediminis TaxID=1493691 RepID=UPI0011058FE3|nr:hypothetical protein [Dyadobacter sediminis]
MQQVSQWAGRDFNINQLGSYIPKTAAGIFPKLLNGFSLMLFNQRPCRPRRQNAGPAQKAPRVLCSKLAGCG